MVRSHFAIHKTNVNILPIKIFELRLKTTSQRASNWSSRLASRIPAEVLICLPETIALISSGTVLLMAAMKGYIEVSRILLAAGGSDINYTNNGFVFLLFFQK